MPAAFVDASRSVVAVTEGGITRYVPVDPENRDYVALVASGVTIASPPVPAPTAADVRAEASRRMQALVGARDADHLAIVIANGTREQGRLQAIRTGIPGVIEPREWTEPEASRAAALWAFDAALEAIRAASNAMEPDPPADYASDARWPSFPT
jgi:hypothetical protein